MIVSITNTKKRVVVVLAVIAIVMLCIQGCGGGFDSDSDNATEFQQSIFGTDTLE